LHQFLLPEVLVVDVLSVVLQILHVGPETGRESGQEVTKDCVCVPLPDEHRPQLDKVAVIFILNCGTKRTVSPWLILYYSGCQLTFHHSPGVEPPPHSLPIHLQQCVTAHHRKRYYLL
jgi:hypothetical protein